MSRSHSATLAAVAMTIGVVFSPLAGVFTIAVACLFLLVVRRSPANAMAFGGVAAAGWLSSQFFKAIVERPRPNPALLFDPLAPETGPWAKPAVVLGLLVSVVVAWSRLYVGVHYPSDVAASFLAASAGVLLFSGVWNRFQCELLPRISLLSLFGPVAAPVGSAPVGSAPVAGDHTSAPPRS